MEFFLPNLPPEVSVAHGPQFENPGLPHQRQSKALDILRASQHRLVASRKHSN